MGIETETTTENETMTRTEAITADAKNPNRAHAACRQFYLYSQGIIDHKAAHTLRGMQVHAQIAYNMRHRDVLSTGYAASIGVHGTVLEPTP